MHYHIIYKVIHDHTCIPAKYWLSEPYKRASYNTSRPEKIFAISLWSGVRLEGTPKSQWFFSGSIPFFTSFQDKPRNITLSGIYIYPIISSWCSITSPIFTSLKHHFPLNPYEISMKSHGKSIMAWTQEHLSHRRQNEHHPKRLRRLILWTSLNIKKKQH